MINHPVACALTDRAPLLSGSDDARHFVLAHGRPFNPTPLPRGMRRRKVGTCFSSAGGSALDRSADGLRYVEGFAISPDHPAPIWHAWLTNGDNTAIDQTWWNALDCSYFGVEFPTPLLAKMLLKRGYHGLMDPVDEAFLSAFEMEAA